VEEHQLSVRKEIMFKKKLCTQKNYAYDDFNYDQKIKRHLKGKHICGCQCHQRLKVKTDGSTLLTYTGLSRELEHLKIEPRLIDEIFGCAMGEFG
jgi:hypothetical protein